MTDTYVYKYGDALYINLTNRCTNDCIFCVRRGGNFGEYNLFLRSGAEPSAKDVIKQLKSHNFKKAREVVFCGYGEPTYNLDVMLEVAKFLMGKVRVRLNTNGLANVIHGFDTTDKIAEVIKHINVSLNAPNAARYNEVSKPDYEKLKYTNWKGEIIQVENAFDEVLKFIYLCKRRLVYLTLSVVGDVLTKDEIDLCRLAAKDIGANFRLRGSM
ncbi:MAG: TatD family nuclease-associated radical SAM protein [Firmicutes bacterium]|nr:TatD family nuclease-associated radical SAM protein [Bacillota bacterium]